MPPRKKPRTTNTTGFTSPPSSSFNDDSTTTWEALSVPDNGLRELVDSRGCKGIECFENGELCDGTVILGDRHIPVSRMMLAASSPFFASALTSKFKEGAEKTIKLDPDLSVRCVEALLRFAHAGASESIRVPATELESLVVAADQLGFTGVLPLAAERLRQTLTPSNCIDRLILSERHGLPTLARGCVEVIGKEFEGMQQSLSSLSQGCLVVLLSHEPAVMPEDRIFELLLAWLQEDPKNRQELFPNLLELVRLPSLGIDYLSENVMYAPSVLGSSKAQELVRSAVRFLGASPEEREKLATKRLRPRHAPLLLPEHTLRVQGTRLVSNFCEFRAEPDGAKPDGRTVEQSEDPFEVPQGWRVVRTSDDDWEQVRKRIIGEYNWSTDVVVVGDGDADGKNKSSSAAAAGSSSNADDDGVDSGDPPHWRGFCARDYNDDEEHPAAEYDRRPNLKLVQGRPNHLQFSGVSYRLLLRREVL